MAARKHPTNKGRAADRSTSRPSPTPAFDAPLESADDIVQRAIEKLKLDIQKLTKKEHVSN